MVACLCIFGAFVWPWAPAQWELFSLKVFLDLWFENESLEPLIDLLAHRETNLWLKNPVFAKNLNFQKRRHWPLLSNFGHSWLAARLSKRAIQTLWKLVKSSIFFFLFWPFWSNSPWLEDVLRIFLWCYPRIQRADIVAQSFIGSRTWIRVFRALDRLSSISGSKLRPERAKYFTDLLGQFRGFP